MFIETNLSGKDRSIRGIIGIIAITMSYHNIMVSGMYDIIFGLVGLGLVGTGAIAHDPIYKLFNFSTKK